MGIIWITGIEEKHNFTVESPSLSTAIPAGALATHHAPRSEKANDD
jgi:hypothetical protein